ncbi:phage tail protein, partial [Mannheimia haemolytica]
HHGERVIVEALANKIPVPLKEMAIGDGNGSSITPSASQTTLVREVYRAEITDLLEDPQNRHQMIAELLIPENVGGFIVREIGLFD